MVLHKKTDSSVSTTTIANSKPEFSDAFANDKQVENNNNSTPVDVYPYEVDMMEELRKQYETVKVVHWIRHAQGYHNVGDAQSRKNIDARLTPLGIKQCAELAEKLATAPDGSRLADVLERTQVIVTSPVTRCIQTALLSLEPILQEHPDMPVIANEDIRETVNFNCDRRRPISEIACDFPMVDFSEIPTDHDAIWKYYEEKLGDDTEYTENRESAEIYVIAERTRKFFDWLGSLEEENIAVCCHQTVSRCIFNYGLPGKTPTDVEQTLDKRGPEEAVAMDVPICNYMHGVDDYMREDFQNCELRSMVLAYNNGQSSDSTDHFWDYYC